MKNKNFTKIIIFWLAAILAVVGIVAGFLYFARTYYYGDRLFVVYRDEQNKAQAVMVELTRYNTMPYFYDYEYSFGLASENSKIYTKEFKFNSLKNSFAAKDFIKKISNENNENILDENYELSIEVENKKIEISLKNMANDFLVNNTPARLTYVNMGSTTIVIDGKSYPAQFIFDKQYSNDYLGLIASQTARAKGAATFFVDNTGRLYYSDISEVFNSKTKYISHAWALNKEGNVLRKDVGKQIVLENNDLKNVAISLPNFDKAEASLNKISSFFMNSTNYNLLSGELVDKNGKKEIIGFSMDYDY